MDLLRLATAGSVDDGKSTLIGRLLYDSKEIFEDQLEAVERASRERGADYLDLSLLTDGLRAEREQGITIDVAYRYFATPRRKFIIADTPGHVQYTRNMVTGASTADLALTLIDARHGALEQTRRHAYIASLLRIPHLLLCVNKMDLVDYDRAVFDEIVEDFGRFAEMLDFDGVTFIPVSALRGDNVVERSARMPWYEGPPLLQQLEEVEVTSDRNFADGRFPVQYVIRPMSEQFRDYRGYAGTVAGGVFRPGDAVAVLSPAAVSSTAASSTAGSGGQLTRIAAIESQDGPLAEAFPPMAVTITLEDDLSVARGDLICPAANRPSAGQEIEATVSWMTEQSELAPGRRLWLKHTTRRVHAIVDELCYRLDVNTLACDESARSLTVNDIGQVRLRLTEPLYYDDYKRNRVTGSFTLIDEATFNTVGAGMIGGDSR